MGKAALCFLISYDHSLTHEKIWTDWIEPNSDIINTYVHYKNFYKITSPWLKAHAIPSVYIQNTSYFKVVPAYMALLTFAFNNDVDNNWFCMLSETCVPIISPSEFRNLFMKNNDKSILNWKLPYWNIYFHPRANLKLLPSSLHLAHDPWFTLCRRDVKYCMQFIMKYKDIYSKVCAGGLANESIFAIILKMYGVLDDPQCVVNSSNTIMDWTRMSSSTSPYIFTGGPRDIQYILNKKSTMNNVMFARKVSKEFSDIELNSIIYGEHNDKK